MANEIRGILYETVTAYALEKAVELAGIQSEVFWNVKPEGMTINPDFTIGNNTNDPLHVILVTASGSAKETDKKFWRNAGELQEVKAQLPQTPTVLNLYYKSEVKKGLAELSLAFYDATLHIDEKPYYKPLQSWVSINLREAAKSKDDKLALLKNDLKTNTQLASSIDALAGDLAIALEQRNTDLDSLWALMKEDYAKPREVSAARTTSVRRGLGKLMVLEPAARKLLYDAYETDSTIKGLPDYAFELGFFARTISGGRLVDKELRGVLELLEPDTCERVLQYAPKSMRVWVNELRQLKNIRVFHEFVDSQFEKVSNPEELLELLIACHKNPEAFANKNALSYTGNLERVWLFTYLVDAIKAHSKRQQGFGYAQLASEVGRSKDINSGYITLADWVNRVEDTDLPAEVLPIVAKVIAQNISEIGQAGLAKLDEKIIDTTIRSILEARLLTYRNFEPLLWLLEEELKRQSKRFDDKVAYTGWINEYADTGRKSATTPFVKVGNALIHWKTVSDAGRVHKKKELAGRARSVKYEYHPETKTFSRREGIDQLVLIVDGTFTNDDLKILSEAGWDKIVYPDEIADLVKEL